MPAIGGVVDYWPSPTILDDFAYFDASVPCAATVAYIYPDGVTMNLLVVDQMGKPFPMTEVKMVANRVGDPLPKDQHYACPHGSLRTSGMERLQMELEAKAAKLDHLRSAIDATPGGKEWRGGLEEEKLP